MNAMPLESVESVGSDAQADAKHLPDRAVTDEYGLRAFVGHLVVADYAQPTVVVR